MQNVETVLEKVENLRKDLSATIDLDSGHMGYDRVFHSGERGVPGTDETKVWISDTAPDMSKVGPAERDLKEIYQNSPWYSARFAADMALHKPASGRRNFPEMDSWFKELEEELSTETSSRAIDDLRGFSIPHFLPAESRWGSKVVLSRTYKCNDDVEVRRAAGKSLGYSNPRIWAHEHPVTAVVAGIAAIGTVSPLVYVLVESLGK